MIRAIKVFVAKRLRDRMMPLHANKLTEQFAIRFNFLQAIILSDGRVKWNWKRLKGIK